MPGSQPSWGAGEAAELGAFSRVHAGPGECAGAIRSGTGAAGLESLALIEIVRSDSKLVARAVSRQ